MDLRNKNIIVTGGASGLGEALALEFLKKNANVLISDINSKNLKVTANKLECEFEYCDVSKEKDVQNLVEKAFKRFGHIDIFCSNAGVVSNSKKINFIEGNNCWENALNVNLMSHVYAAKYLLPNMINRNQGYFLQIISAAALLSQIGDAAYSASKSAALSFAESLAINNGHLGIKVSAVCPQYIATPMLGMDKDNFTNNKNLISAQTAASRIIKGLIEERFLIFTDDKTDKLFKKKSENYESWIIGMQKLKQKILDETGDLKINTVYKFLKN